MTRSEKFKSQFSDFKKQWPDIRKKVLPWVGIFIGNMVVSGFLFAAFEGMPFARGILVGPYWGVVSGTTTGYGEFTPNHVGSALVTVWLLLSSAFIWLFTGSKLTEVMVKNPHLYSDAEQKRSERKSDYIIAMNEIMFSKIMGYSPKALAEYEALQKAIKVVEDEEKNK